MKVKKAVRGRDGTNFQVRQTMNNPKVGDLIYWKDLGLVRILKVRSAERDLDLRVQDSRGLLWDVNSNYASQEAPSRATITKRKMANYTNLLTSGLSLGDCN